MPIALPKIEASPQERAEIISDLERLSRDFRANGNDAARMADILLRLMRGEYRQQG